MQVRVARLEGLSTSTREFVALEAAPQTPLLHHLLQVRFFSRGVGNEVLVELEREREFYNKAVRHARALPAFCHDGWLCRAELAAREQADVRADLLAWSLFSLHGRTNRSKCVARERLVVCWVHARRKKWE